MFKVVYGIMPIEVFVPEFYDYYIHHYEVIKGELLQELITYGEYGNGNYKYFAKTEMYTIAKSYFANGYYVSRDSSSNKVKSEKIFENESDCIEYCGNKNIELREGKSYNIIFNEYNIKCFR